MCVLARNPDRAVSVETASSEIVGYDDVGNGVKDKLNVLRVGGAGLVAVNLLIL